MKLEPVKVATTELSTPIEASVEPSKLKTFIPVEFEITPGVFATLIPEDPKVSVSPESFTPKTAGLFGP